jgi:hypothetical protein
MPQHGVEVFMIPSDSSKEAPASAILNNPRGFKLDAKKREEYQFDVAQADTWDSSAWPTWTVTGRVLPERCDVNVAATVSHGVGAGGRVKSRLEVVRSHIVVMCALENSNPTVFQIADFVRSILAFPIDYVAFQNRGAYEVVLDLCINNQTGQALPIPVFEPTFETGGAGLCFNAHADKSNLNIPWAAAAVPELPTALRDLTAAVRYPRRTFEYCRMAAEMVRRRFDPPTIRSPKERRHRGEAAMCSALRISRESLGALDGVAARSRHGELVFSIRWEMRKRALEFVWELVARFIEHLQGTSNEHWTLLDVRFED